MMMLNTKICVGLLAVFASTASAANNNNKNENKNKRHLRKGNTHRRTARKDKTMTSILANDITEDVAFWTRSLQMSVPVPTPPVVRPPTPNPTMPNVPVPVPTPFPTPMPQAALVTNPPIDAATGTPSYSPTPAAPVTDDPNTGTPSYSPTPAEPAASNTPVANDDSATVGAGGDLAFVSVLANDTPADGQTLNVRSILTNASNGDCSVSLDLTEVVYFPNDGFTGEDSCEYEACDAVPVCDTATVDFTVG